MNFQPLQSSIFFKMLRYDKNVKTSAHVTIPAHPISQEMNGGKLLVTINHGSCRVRSTPPTRRQSVYWILLWGRLLSSYFFRLRHGVLLQSWIELAASSSMRLLSASNELLSVLALFARNLMFYSPKGESGSANPGGNES